MILHDQKMLCGVAFFGHPDLIAQDAVLNNWLYYSGSELSCKKSCQESLISFDWLFLLTFEVGLECQNSLKRD